MFGIQSLWSSHDSTEQPTVPINWLVGEDSIILLLCVSTAYIFSGGVCPAIDIQGSSLARESIVSAKCMRRMEKLEPQKILYMTRETDLKTTFSLFITARFNWFWVWRCLARNRVRLDAIRSLVTFRVSIGRLLWESHLHQDMHNWSWGWCLCSSLSLILLISSTLDIISSAEIFLTWRKFSRIPKSC